MRRFAPSPGRIPLVIAVVLGSAAACDSPPTTSPQVAALSIAGLPELIGVGDTVILGAEALDANGRPVPGARVAWDVSDPAVAKVDSTGRLVALAAGNVTLHAISGVVAKDASARVERLPRSFTLTLPRQSLLIADTATATATVNDGLGIPIAGTAIEWGTTDTTVLRVDAGGHIRGVGQGTASITLRSGTLSTSLPVTVDFPRVMPTHSFASASMGYFHVCGITVGGEARCSGDNGYGQLSGSDEGDQADAKVIGSQALVSISSGQFHTCGLTADGTAYCWGQNNRGQAGIGSAGEPERTPVRVAGDVRFTKLVPGLNSSVCGLTTSGLAYCWGTNSLQVLGITSGGSNVLVPTLVPGDVHMTDIAVGAAHECGVGPGGKVYCWGLNKTGAVGQPPSDVVITTPTEIQGGHSFVSVTAGWYHSCALTAAGEAWCWGRNAYGELGRGTADGAFYSVPERVSGGLTFSKLVAGGANSCGITTGGLLYCWGREPGNDWQIQSAVPVPVSTTRRYKNVSAHYGSCAVAEDGALYCWGW